MRSPRRSVPGGWILLPGIVLALAAAACGPRNQRPTEILWDRWGVPHIHAAEPGELFRAFGWAQMKNHANLILRLYGEARGRAAEYWGESYLFSDRYLRTMGVPERAQQWYGAQKPRFKGYLDRFVEGMNAYARRHPESIDPELEPVLPLDPTDVLGHLQRVIHLSFVGREVTFGRAGQPVPGSNGWAIAPSRSAGGNAMLLVNPHLPWSSTLPRLLNPGDFPAYLAPRGMRFRAQRSVRMLEQDRKISFETLSRYKHSTRMELADRILDELTAAVGPRSSDLSRQAARVLEDWDRRADAGSRGAVLFAEWVRTLGAGMFATPWQEQEPLATPKGLADPDAAVAALEKAARVTRDRFGSLDVPWGEVYRLRIGERDLPASGGPSRLGIFRSLEFVPETDGRFRALFGDSFVALVEFSQPVRASALLSYGNASQPDSPHRGDQLALFARKQLRPVWRTRKEIEAHLESREVLPLTSHQ